MARAIIIDETEGVRLRVVADSVRVLASGKDTNGTHEIFELTGPRDSGPPPHAHPWSEAYMVSEGTLDVSIGNDTFDVRPGCFFSVPAGMIHTYRITSESAKLIIVSSPAGMADFFHELDAEEDFEKIVGVALKHGFTLPPPPMAM